jgi:outer membrane cobalamin receptor
VTCAIQRACRLALALAAAGAAPVAAQDPAPGPDRLRYDVYVSEEGDLVEEIAPRRVVEESEIRERSARTLDEAIRFEPGVTVRLGNEGVPRVDFRGLRSRHVLLLLDGIPFNSTEDGQFDPALIPTEGMERVRLQFGNASALYGDGPIGGVIQIETVEPADGMHAEVDGDLRSERQALGRFRASGRQGDVDLFAAGSLFHRHGFPLSDDFDGTPTENGGRRDNSIRERGNLLVKGGWTPTETMRIGALVTAVDGSYQVPPNVADAATDPFAQRVRYERVEDLHGGSGQLSMQWDPEGPLSVRSWVFANQLEEDRRRYDDDSYDSIDDPRVSGTFRQRGESRVTGGTVHAGYALGAAGRLKAALQTRREEFDVEGTIRDVRAGGGRFDLRDFDEDSHQGVFSGGLEYEVSPLANTGLVVGYDHSFLRKDQGQNDDGPVFLAGAFWDPWTRTRLRASVARKIRFPSLRQLYEQGTGNPDLDAERAWDYEVGVTQQLPWATVLDVTGFWMDVEDFIERPPGVDVFQNNDRYRFRGVEVSVDARPFEPIAVRTSYGFLDSENRSHGSPEHQLPNRPRHRVALEVQARLPFGVEGRIALAHVADQVNYSRQDPVQQRDGDDATLLDLKLLRRFREDRLALYVGVDNVNDADYEPSYGVPEAGRVFYGGLEGRF